MSRWNPKMTLTMLLVVDGEMFAWSSSSYSIWIASILHLLLLSSSCKGEEGQNEPPSSPCHGHGHVLHIPVFSQDHPKIHFISSILLLTFLRHESIGSSSCTSQTSPPGPSWPTRWPCCSWTWRTPPPQVVTSNILFQLLSNRLQGVHGYVGEAGAGWGLHLCQWSEEEVKIY